MSSIRKWSPVVLAVAVFAGFSWAAPITLNNLLIPHNQDESGFPATATNTKGAIVFGTDAGVLYMSPGDGGAWQPLAISGPNETVAPSHLGGYFGGGVLSNGVVVIQSRFTAPATFTRLSSTIATAGVDGAHNFTIDVFDLTTTTVVCVTGSIPCNSVAGGGFSVACSSSVATADDVQLRVNDGACLTTAPLLNVAAEYR